MELTWEKWLVMAALALISAFLGVLPYLVLDFFKSSTSQSTNKPGESSTTYKIILTILSCFGGGVLLATAIVHMLADARIDLASIPEITETFESDFPLSEILTLVGFSLIYLVEEVAHFIMVHEHPHSHHQHEHHRGSQSSVAHSISLSHRKMSRISSMENSTNCDSLAELAVPQSSFEDQVDAHSVGSTVRSLLALIALSFHAIMEGVAIGIEDSAGVWFMFGAIASHKFVISFCMGMELFASQAKKSTYFGSIIFFAIVSPLGILIGSLISGGSANFLPIAIIKGLATGTLLYVVFFEILSREKEKQSEGRFNEYTRIVGFIQFLSMLVGMTAMVILVTQTGHAHAHAEDDHSDSTEEPGHEHLAVSKVLTTITERLLTIT